MSFEEIAIRYLRELQREQEGAVRGGHHTPELSYRPVLDRFFRDLAGFFGPSINVIFEPARQYTAGRPDWRFHNENTMGIYGYVEAKEFNPARSLDIRGHEPQINRYLELRHKLIVTDGIDFYFYFPQENRSINVQLVRKPVRRGDWGRIGIDPLIEVCFRNFFSGAEARRCSEIQLVEELARIARVLSVSVNELSELPAEAGVTVDEINAIAALNDLKIIVENHHDTRLHTRKAFADFVSQVLIFGLLYAHRVVAGHGLTPRARFETMHSFWSDVAYREHSERLRPFQALVGILEAELDSALSPLGTWYQHALMLLSHVELDRTQVAEPDYHTLYERFLEAFDPETRFDFGAYYTPKELARYMVRFVNSVVAHELPGQNLYDTNNKLIDPCCGTGTYIEELIINAGERAGVPRIIGFEILPAPYALAHYRLAMLRNENPLDNVSIILTNTVCDELEQVDEVERTPENLIEVEQAEARKLVRIPITLVIGNPPSSDSTARNEGENETIIRRLVNDFRPPEEDRRNRQNTQKQMRNRFVEFLRWSCNKLIAGNPGILALILPSSFAEQSSYTQARKWISEHFNKIWVMDIDSDARTGVRSSSLFNTLQGRLLLVAITGFPGHNDGDTEFSYYNITNLTREGKLTFLSEERIDELATYTRLELDDNVVFRPGIPFDRNFYDRFWQLHPAGNTPLEGENYIFERHCSGLKLAPTAMFVHSNKDLLYRRTREIADQTRTKTEIKETWFSGQDKPPRDNKLTDGIRASLNRILENQNVNTLPILRYSFRPFLNMHAFIHAPFLREMSRQCGGGTRLRPEVIAAFDQGSFGIAIAPSPKEIGDRLHRFASFCWHLPDNDLCTRVNSHVFCNRFPNYGLDGRENGFRAIPNINPRLVRAIAHLLDLTEARALDEIVFYVYALLCSDTYLDSFEGALFTTTGTEWIARIPITSNATIFRNLSQKGRRLAVAENYNIPTGLSPELEIFHGHYDTPFRLRGFENNVDEEALILKGNTQEITLTPINREILLFKVSGYNVVDTWLKFHSYRYTRSVFTKIEFTELLQLLRRIQIQLELVREIDNIVITILSDDAQLIE